MKRRVLLLCGGVGGARLAHGFQQLGGELDLHIAVNVGDDFEHLGLTICPDLDTVLYTLAGLANREQGWGLQGESWRALNRLAELEGETWFRLGDLDLATHLLRSGELAKGRTLSEVAEKLAKKLGVSAQVMPATNDRVRTVLDTDIGLLDFQHYFVKEQCVPRVRSISYTGIDGASPSPPLLALLKEKNEPLDAVILTPSNPFLSLAPSLRLPGLIDHFRTSNAPVIAVSPIIGGRAVKGPAAKLMAELSIPISAAGWAKYMNDCYPGLVDEWVLDTSDSSEADALCGDGLMAVTTHTLMRSDEDRKALASWLIGRVSKV